MQSILQIHLTPIVASLGCRAAAWILLHFLQRIIPKSDKKQILLHFIQQNPGNKLFRSLTQEIAQNTAECHFAAAY